MGKAQLQREMECARQLQHVAAAQRANRLTHAEFEREATWATRKFVPFVMQRISVAVQIAAATEIRQALGWGMGPDSA